MRLLLDTHVLLAVLHSRVDELGPEVALVLKSGEHAFYVSVASLWEIAIKFRLGKLFLAVPLESLPDLLDDMGLELLPITAGQVLVAAEPQPTTRDPFDRLLLGICQAERLQLLTIDRALIAHRLTTTVSPSKRD